MAKKCSDTNYKPMLLPYVEQVLAKQNKSEVEQHLRACEACREDVHCLREVVASFVELIQADYKVSFAEHPVPGKIFEYVVEPYRLSEEELKRIQLHLLMCRKCGQKAEILKQVEDESQSRILVDQPSVSLPAPLRSLLEQKISEFEKSFPAQEESSEIPSFEQLLALAYKFNWKRIALVLFAFVFAFWGIKVALTPQGGEDAKKDVLPSPLPSATQAANEAQEVYLPVSVDILDRVCEVLDRAKIPYETQILEDPSQARINFTLESFVKAKLVLQKEGLLESGGFVPLDRLPEATNAESSPNNDEDLSKDPSAESNIDENMDNTDNNSENTDNTENSENLDNAQNNTEQDSSGDVNSDNSNESNSYEDNSTQRSNDSSDNVKTSETSEQSNQSNVSTHSKPKVVRTYKTHRTVVTAAPKVTTRRAQPLPQSVTKPSAPKTYVPKNTPKPAPKAAPAPAKIHTETHQTLPTPQAIPLHQEEPTPLPSYKAPAKSQPSYPAVIKAPTVREPVRIPQVKSSAAGSEPEVVRPTAKPQNNPSSLDQDGDSALPTPLTDEG